MLQIGPEEIGDDQPLFGPGSVGLDSVDALQLVVALTKRMGLRSQIPKRRAKFFKVSPPWFGGGKTTGINDGQTIGSSPTCACVQAHFFFQISASTDTFNSSVAVLRHTSSKKFLMPKRHL